MRMGMVASDMAKDVKVLSIPEWISTVVSR